MNLGLADEQQVSEALQHPDRAAHLAYYQRWVRKELQRNIDQHFRQEAENRDPRWLPLDRYSEDLQLQILDRLQTVQLSSGCSGIQEGCNFCGFDAVALPREHLPFPAVRRLIEQLKMYNTSETKTLADKVFFFWASDVFDYRSEEDGEARTYTDVHMLAQSSLGYTPYVSTVAPRRSDDIMRDFVSKGGIIDRISVVSEKHRSSLQRRGILGLSDYVPSINKQPLGRYGSVLESGNMNFGGAIGIGCFNGAMMSPRGVYSILNMPVSDPYSAPQGLLAVPFCGDDQRCPSPGDPTFQTLSQHIPLSDVTRGVGNCKGSIRLFEELLDRSVFVIELPDRSQRIVTCNAQKILSVERTDDYEYLSRIYASVGLNAAGKGALLTMSKSAHLFDEQVEPELPPDDDLIRSYFRKKLSQDRIERTERLLCHPAMDQAFNGTGIEPGCYHGEDRCDKSIVQVAIFLFPHWMLRLQKLKKAESGSD